jgi:hypothetical protein
MIIKDEHMYIHMLSTDTKEGLIEKFGMANNCVKEEEYLEIPDSEDTLSNTKVEQNIPKVDHIKYNYPIVSTLQPISSAKGNIMSVCLYRINTGGMLPFVEYMMYRYSKKQDNLIIFPTYPCANRSIKTALNDFKKDIIEDTSISFNIQGCLTHNNMPFIFVKLPATTTTTTIEDKPSMQFIWITISEIVNLRHVYSNPIHSSATQLFCNNPVLTQITTSKDALLESPDVFYVGDKYEKIIYESVFGLTKSTLYASLGPFYYLGTFDSALKYALTDKFHPYISKSSKKKSYGGVLRCVVFVGKLKVIRNKIHNVSASYIEPVIENDPKMKKYIQSVQHMRDNAGEWADKYNSVIAGRIPLKGGKLYKKEPQIVVRAYHQQLPLSWRIIK